ncbi:MAG TPA: cell division protein FtsX [Flavobacteriales bacterium]|nr:cell division protein FtsX [Flavobacteriales bacterium]
MSGEKENKSARRYGSANISTIVGMSLVLFVLGLLGLILLNAKMLSDYAKENIGFAIYLNKNVKEADVIQLKKTLDAEIYVKSTEYIDEERAVEILKEDLGEEEDFMDFLEYNPLLASIDIKLNPEYAHLDSLNVFESRLLENPQIHEVDIRKDLAVLINENVRKISLLLLCFTGLLLIIAVGLINNTIRLTIYSQRFLIKTMQLVGATHGFIRRPFVIKGIVNGIISALLAILFLYGVFYLTQQNLPELIDLQNIELYLSLFTIVMVLGILISWVSTSLAVSKYLRAQTGDLYY